MPNRLDRLITASMPVVGIVLASRLTLEIAARPWNDWDPVRLAPVFALWHGHPLYPTPATGPPLSYCYGPVSALAYLPVVVATTPTAALLVAATMSVLFMLGPVLWLYLDRRILGPRRALDGVLAFMAVTAILLGTPALTYSLFSPVHDAVALGLGAIAAGVACRRRADDGPMSLAVSAVAAVLAVWAKQTMVPLLIALPIYVLVVEGRRSCVQYVTFVGAAGLAVSLLFFATFDRSGLLLNMFEVPSRHPVDKSLHDVLGALALQILYSGLAVALIGIALLSVRGIRTGDRRERSSVGPWLAFVLIGVLQTPLALLAFAKLGGDLNAFSSVLYHFAIGTGLLLLQLDVPRTATQTSGATFRIGKVWLLALAVLALVAPRRVTPGLDTTRPNPSEAAFAFERKHPGRAYFPWNTLSVVMADGRAYAAEDGVLSHTRMAGLPVSAERLRAHLPPDAKLLAFPPNYPVRWTGDFMREQLPEFRRPVRVRELPGWRCLKRDRS